MEAKLIGAFILCFGCRKLWRRCDGDNTCGIVSSRKPLQKLKESRKSKEELLVDVT